MTGENYADLLAGKMDSGTLTPLSPSTSVFPLGHIHRGDQQELRSAPTLSYVKFTSVVDICAGIWVTSRFTVKGRWWDLPQSLWNEMWDPLARLLIQIESLPGIPKIHLRL